MGSIFREKKSTS